MSVSDIVLVGVTKSVVCTVDPAAMPRFVVLSVSW